MNDGLPELTAKPLVSVIVPSYNQGRYIRETIVSILAQDYRPIEVLVIDGASTDETVSVLRSFGTTPELTWISEPDRGVVDAVNKGFGMARGEIGAIQSSDDAYLRGSFASAVSRLVRDPSLGFVFGDIVKIDADGRDIMTTDLGPFSIEAVLSTETWIPQPSTFFRMDLARRMGGWREDIPYSPDTALWLRMAFHANALKLDQVMARRRMHGQQRDKQGPRIIRDYSRMLETLPEMQTAPPRYRRAARAGKMLLINHYTPDAPYLLRLARQWAALLLYPRSVKDFGVLSFVPYWNSLCTLVKRRFEGRPVQEGPSPRLPPPSVREYAGVVCFDLPRWLPRLAAQGRWVRIANRADRVELSDDGVGVRIDGPWSSDLHACRVFPSLGRRLMLKSFGEWPIRFAGESHLAAPPDITFVIPHRGLDRLPLLLATLESIMGQEDVRIECIVVEQATVRDAGGLPPGIRHIHRPHPSDPVGWRKSWAFNVGVRESNAPIVVCHDGDIPVPSRYAREILHRIRDQGYDVVHLQRFLFCLGEADTRHLLDFQRCPARPSPERVRQNWQGGTLAILKDAFLRIGGYDEDFVNWGGEDNEFFDRCCTLRSWRYGYLPFVHLNHASQPAKTSADAARNQQLLREKLRVPAATRIAALRDRTVA